MSGAFGHTIATNRREGWICPLCRRGVSPDEKSCDHGGTIYGLPVTPLGPTTTRAPLTGDPLPDPMRTTCGTAVGFGKWA